ncbi:2-C-methyl-D-erythritol 4-phosphate cytidylyltransferase [mine drainage metagenome]|uniref:2-C-methyl-D-erythritol 4-phosphate cytidylyltransferase n=1 Tax=mine drainage metagenome TaxID=410659 RepID=A0A1J5QDI4_9ZZZZ
MSSALSAGVIPAAGSGERLGAKKPKALIKVGGRTLIGRAAKRLSQVVDEIVVAAPAGHEVEVAKSLRKLSVPVVVITGGANRTESVSLALAHLTPEVRYVLIHDAARAFAPVSLLQRVLQAVRNGADAVVPALAVSDTIKIVDENEHVKSTLKRESLRAVQTPQGFTRDLIERAHREAVIHERVGTDDASLVEAIGATVLVIPGDARAHKITIAADLARHRKLKRKGKKS